MKSFDQLLHDPQSYGEQPSRAQLESWNEGVLEAWAEHRRSPVTTATSFWQTALYRGSLVIAGILILSMLWNRFAFQDGQLRSLTLELPPFLSEELTSHPYWIVMAIVSLVVFMTKPLRDLLLSELA